MRGPASGKSPRAARKLYWGAKISDYQFRTVLWHFALDHSAREAAQRMALSANSIGAIYAKLRRFFFEYGLFRSLYRGGDPRQGLAQADDEMELAILTFHLGRVSRKRGQLDARPGEPDRHFAESNWRLNFVPVMRERRADATHKMMYAHLLEFVRRFGPIGRPDLPSPDARLAGHRLALEQLERLMLWIERNSVQFRHPDDRASLRAMRHDDEP